MWREMQRMDKKARKALALIDAEPLHAMDSRIMNALEYIVALDINPRTTSLSAITRIRMAAAKAREAISILSAEPEPCEDAHEWDALTKEQMWNEIQDIRRMVDADGTMSICSSIDSYASRREQEAREDERVRCADGISELWIRTLKAKGKHMGLIELRSAILQGAEPAKATSVFVATETDGSRWVRLEDYDRAVETLRYALTEASEAMEDLRGYCSAWEWKYKEQWDHHEQVVKEAIYATAPQT
jgi:hypothetical protein